MLARVVAAALVALLLGPSADAAYLQVGGDAARTGTIEGPGPVLNETAFQIELPGNSARAPPLWTDHGLMVLVADLNGDPARSETGVYFVDVATATVQKHIDLPPYAILTQAQPHGPTEPVVPEQWVLPPTWASDGQRLFISTDDGFMAYDVATGQPSWSAPFVWDGMVEGKHWMLCVPPAVADGSLFVACDIYEPLPQPGPSPAFFWASDLMVARIDAETGTLEWDWRRPATSRSEDACDTDADPYLCSNPDEGRTLGMSVVEGRVVLLHRPYLMANFPFESGATGSVLSEVNEDGCGPMNHPQFEYWGIDSATGEQEWLFDELGDQQQPRGWAGGPTVYPSGARGEVFLIMGTELVIVDSSTGDVRERIPIGEDDSKSLMTGSGFRVPSNGREVIASTGQSLYRVDLETLALDPARAIYKWPTESATFFATEPLFESDGIVYARAVEFTGSDCDLTEFRTVLAAIDLEHQERAWVQNMTPGGANMHFDLPSYVGIDGGNAAWVTNNGTLRVLGRTPASIQPAMNWSTLAPQPNETVEVDLAGSSPGVFGPPDRFHVDWGDGNETEWQTDANFTHAYDDIGAYTVTVSMENDASQRSSEAVRLLVGPPAATPAEDTGAGSSVVQREGIAWWWILLAAIGASIVTGAGAWALRVAREPDHEKRYRTAVRRSLEADEDPTTILRPLREAWGISEAQHARILAEEREAAGEGPASARLVVGAMFLDRYRVLSRLGAGAQGRAYLCQDEKTGRRVVIKAARAPKDAQTHILREAKAFAKIRSPHLVRMIDIDAVGRDVFLVLEYAGEGDLHGALADGPLARDEAVGLAATLYAALQDLHKARLVHGDLSPHNVFGSPGNGFVVGDLGLSRSDGKATAVSPGAGTPGYVAPEVAAGGKHSVASDLYAAGLLVVAALTGDPDGADGLDAPLRRWARKAAHADPRRRHADAEAAWKAFRKASAAEQQ